MVVLKERNGRRSASDSAGDMKSPLKSPLKPRKSLTGVLSPNDDANERRATRAKQSEMRARRRSLNLSGAEANGKDKERSSRDAGKQRASVLELQELYQNCIKLSSENKISSKNTWDLNLIEHLSELVKPENNKLTQDQDTDLNFQKASCTLDAGVKIYSSRVDSIHTDAFKVLGGLHRTSNEQEDDLSAGMGDGVAGKKTRRSRKQVDIDPSATLEQNQDALNVKKFDLSFTVDPLFHQTSMKFDEGGAKGLLLNHLHVTQGCELVFDSCDNRYNRLVKNQRKDENEEKSGGAEEDLRLEAFDSIADHVAGLQACEALRLTNSSKELERVLNQQQTAEDEAAISSQVQRWLCLDPSDPSLDDSSYDYDDVEPNDDDPCISDSLGPWMDSGDVDVDSDGEEVNDSDGSAFGMAAGAFGEAGEAFGGGGGGGLAPSDGGVSTDWLSQIGLSNQFNKSSWAGMSHWRYRGAPPKPTGASEAAGGEASADKEAKKKGGKAKSQMIDFENLPPLPKEAFRMAKTDKEISLKTDPQSSQIEYFPEDVHYEVSNLGKLFSKPMTTLRQLCSGRRGQATEGGDMEDYDDDGDFGATSLGFDDFGDEGEEPGFGSGGALDSAMDAPRMVEQIDINYDRKSKQVDVKKLKEALWVSLQKESGEPEDDDEEEGLDETASFDFQSVLDTMGDTMENAGKKEDVSLHLCFICLLHLANENTLKIEDAPTLDRLTIQQE